MGEAELNFEEKSIIIHSHIITYGSMADDILTERIRSEIETMWNEPGAFCIINNATLQVSFRISSELKKDIDQMEVLQNTNPLNNYFRIESFVHGNISFVDGLGSNSGYFLLENLYEGSTTAAHEYGHTLGLDHPDELDIRGEGVPGIMYPRGTLVDPQFQYDSAIPAGMKGGTMHPMYRKVRQKDIEYLKLNKLRFIKNNAIIGTFTNVYHWSHEERSMDV